jgi:arginyl-tRNA synthetase
MWTVNIFQAILNNLPSSDIVQSTSVAGPGYVNIVISSDWIAKVIYMFDP